VGIYELIAGGGMELPVSQEFLDVYAAALAAFKERRWARGDPGLPEGAGAEGGRHAVEDLRRARQGLPRSCPPADWEAVFDLTSK